MAEQMNAAPQTTQDDRLMALLSYIFPIIVPLIILLSDGRKNRPLQSFMLYKVWHYQLSRLFQV